MSQGLDGHRASRKSYCATSRYVWLTGSRRMGAALLQLRPHPDGGGHLHLSALRRARPAANWIDVISESGSVKGSYPLLIDRS